MTASSGRPSMILSSVLIALIVPLAAHAQKEHSAWAFGLRGQIVMLEDDMFSNVRDGRGVVGFVQRRFGNYFSLETGFSVDRHERQIICVSDLHSRGSGVAFSAPCSDGYEVQSHIYLRPALRLPGLPFEPYGGFEVGLLHGEINSDFEDEFPAVDVGFAGGVVVPLVGRLAAEAAVASTWLYATHATYQNEPRERWGRRVAFQLGFAIR